MEFHGWAHPWITEHYQYKCAHGGRFSGKTTNVSGAGVVLARGVYPGAYIKPPIRFICLREQMNSIRESVYYELELRIDELRLGNDFKFTRSEITCTATGSVFHFKGLKDYNSQTIKGFSNYDVAWVEEAQEVSHRSMDLLVPTILRRDNAEIWGTMNRFKRSDWWDRYIIKPKKHPSRLLIYVNFDKNPHLTDAAKQTVEIARETMPEKFAHIYLGKPDDGDGLDLMVTEEMVSACLKGGKQIMSDTSWRTRRWRKKLLTGTGDAGLDLAEKGTNALAIRRGPFIEYLDVRSNKTDTEIYAWMFAECRGLALRVYYDCTGVGGHFHNRHREAVDEWDAVHYPLGIIAERFGGKVMGPDTPFLDVFTNKDQFEYRNAQMGWLLRIRAMNSIRYVRGEDVNPLKCLFFSPTIPQTTKDNLLLDLCKPEYELKRNGQIRVKKDPDESGSPHLYDACVLAFCRDSETGIMIDEWR